MSGKTQITLDKNFKNTVQNTDRVLKDDDDDDYAYYYYYLVFRFRSRNALTPVEAIDLPAWVSMSLSYTMLSAKALKREV